MFKFSIPLTVLSFLFASCPSHVTGVKESMGHNQDLCHFSNIKKLDENFYFGRLKVKNSKNLWLVMERLDDSNYGDWCHYISVQSNPCAVNIGACVQDSNGNLVQPGFSNDGSYHFKLVLDESYNNNQVWVAYITKAAWPQKSSGKLSYYDSSELINADHPFAKNIEIFVTVTSSPDAIITSHMGVSCSIEGILHGRQKGTSLDLHSFAAKVMLTLNPNRRFMINAPVFAVEKMLADAIEEHVFVGTHQMQKIMQESLSVSFEDFAASNKDQIRKEIQKEAYKGLEATKRRIDREKRKMEEANEPISNLSSYLNDLLELSDEKNIQISEKGIHERLNIRLQRAYEAFKNPYYFPAKSAYKRSSDFLGFMEKHPPILSILGEGNNKKFTVFDPANPEAALLTIDESNKNSYRWMFEEPFRPAGATHYIAVDLQALARLKQLDDLDDVDYTIMGAPFNIVIDPRAYSLNDLKNNLSVMDLTIEVPKNGKAEFASYEQIIKEGLQNKPNLKSLTIKGDFHVDLFFGYGSKCMGDSNILNQDLLQRSHLSFFANLEKLAVTGEILGANRNDMYFITDFIPYLEKYHALTSFTYGSVL